LISTLPGLKTLARIAVTPFVHGDQTRPAKDRLSPDVQSPGSFHVGLSAGHIFQDVVVLPRYAEIFGRAHTSAPLQILLKLPMEIGHRDPQAVNYGQSG